MSGNYTATVYIFPQETTSAAAHPAGGRRSGGRSRAAAGAAAVRALEGPPAAWAAAPPAAWAALRPADKQRAERQSKRWK